MAHPWPSSLAAQSQTIRNTAQLIGTVIARTCIGARFQSQLSGAGAAARARLADVGS